LVRHVRREYLQIHRGSTSRGRIRTADRCLCQGHRQPPGRAVVRRAEQLLPASRCQEVLQPAFGVEVDRGRLASHKVMYLSPIRPAAQPPCPLSEQEEPGPRLLEVASYLEV